MTEKTPGTGGVRRVHHACTTCAPAARASKAVCATLSALASVFSNLLPAPVLRPVPVPVRSRRDHHLPGERRAE